MPLWVREITKKILIRSLFIFLSVMALFSLIDFSINSSNLSNAKVVILFQYYLIQGSNYLEIFLPLSFLIATIKTLSEMNINKELTALFSSGLSKKRLFTPIFAIALALSLVCFFNNEKIIPKTSKFINDFQLNFFESKYKGKQKKVHSLLLSNQTHLIFSNYDQDKKTLEDIFWIKSFNDIWHIAKIHLINPPVAYFSDHLTREQNNRLIKRDSHKEIVFSDLLLTEKILHDALIPLEQKPLTELFMSCKNDTLEIAAEKKVLASTRTLFSLSFFLITICLAPFSINFSRSFSPILITSISIFSFICFYMIINALSILCINQVLSCSLALWFPTILILLFGLYNFTKEQP